MENPADNGALPPPLGGTGGLLSAPGAILNKEMLHG